MIENKKILLVFLVIISFTLISGVSATNNSFVKESTGNFTELNNKLASSDSILLDKDYLYEYGENNITINKSAVIDGKEHSIDVNKKDNLINLNDDVVIKDISFKNINKTLFDNNCTNITFIDCEFFVNNTDNIISVDLPIDDNVSYSGEISDEIIDLAFSIVGNSTGIEAAQLLAQWVNDNIKHETKAGFYQTPEETLERKKGNCCCHTELLLQMCVAVGVDEEHTLSIVHVGTMEFGSRHFFCLIDNICVDTDYGYSNPWGRGGISNNDIYQITEYPLLPITRGY